MSTQDRGFEDRDFKDGGGFDNAGYELPASNEEALYAQLNTFSVKIINPESVQ